MLNILGFLSHIVGIVTTQLWLFSDKAAIDNNNMKMNGMAVTESGGLPDLAVRSWFADPWCKVLDLGRSAPLRWVHFR